jgi:hypothetical protein
MCCIGIAIGAQDIRDFKGRPYHENYGTGLWRRWWREKGVRARHLADRLQGRAGIEVTATVPPANHGERLQASWASGRPSAPA